MRVISRLMVVAERLGPLVVITAILQVKDKVKVAPDAWVPHALLVDLAQTSAIELSTLKAEHFVVVGLWEVFVPLRDEFCVGWR